MKNEFTAIIEEGDDGWWLAHSPEVPAANGQGRTPTEAVDDLAGAIELVLEHLLEEAIKVRPSQSLLQTVSVG